MGRTLAPVFLAVAPVVARMTSKKQLRKFSGYVPRVDNSGLKEGKGQSMTKAGPAQFKRGLFFASDLGRKCDPQFARVYWRAMVENGFPHTKALCEATVHIVDRPFRVIKDNRLCELRDAEGNPISAREDREIVRTKYTVSEEVRARLRRRKKHEGGSSDETDDAARHLPTMLAPSRPRGSTEAPRGQRATGVPSGGQPSWPNTWGQSSSRANLAARQPDSLALSMPPRRGGFPLRNAEATAAQSSATVTAPSEHTTPDRQTPFLEAGRIPPQPYPADASGPPAAPAATLGGIPENGQGEGVHLPLNPGSAQARLQPRGPAIGAAEQPRAT